MLQAGRFCLVPLILIGGIIGCETKPPAANSGKAPAGKPDSKADEKVPEQSEPDEIRLAVIDAAGLQAAVDTHTGKVVLVDCWATWCDSCVKAFPHTVELSRKLADQGLVVMSLSFDDPEAEKIAKVRAFLREQEATFENYVSKLDLADDGADAFGINDGALPHYKVYDRSGKLLKSLSAADPDQSLTPETLEAAVTEALQSPAP